eukprot:CAMPEP_0197290866 /NCGR_PEP_ID=MMETSP0890-20130614/10273_1 /TAXON_ID=44058 ORGANISM="Aureoumbra lagunensis, Strain CCMP1510" /NCGR_SAMPLE_ID=MMETSP0890 /ASSEMBLY_ACC=CAM_ASM_000533 /LENGTH=562 /DNA_ID=CAMNT_0042763221 /DNA_START=211 /DNA_END=1899 /DNA_ORIENTATION=-
MGHTQRNVPILLFGATAGAALILGAQHVTKRLEERRKKKRRQEEEECDETHSISSSLGSEHSSSPSEMTRPVSPPSRMLNIEALNREFGSKEASAESCIKWAVSEFGEALVMSTSFGMQSAVLLHMATRICPNLPIIWIDTGYLHRETYLFARHLAKRLELNLYVYQSDISAARMEALHGQLWNNDDDTSHRVYGVLRKVAPMNKALRDLNARALLSGVRRGQTDHRKTLQRIVYHDSQRHYRVHPLLFWTDEDVDAYMTKHKLPYHPLKRKGFVSIGDKHSTKAKSANDSNDRSTRFGGKRQECGLHTEKADPAELDALVRQLIEDDFSSEPTNVEKKKHGTNNKGQKALLAPPLLTKTDSTGEFFSSRNGAMNSPPSDDDSEEDEFAQVKGFEIYGRDSCKFCEAACRVLTARDISYKWRTMQRFNQATGKLEPAVIDGIHSVSRAHVQRRVDHVAPGSPPIETVPQIFLDGDYIGGYVDLCQFLHVPKPVMEVALLKIGGAVPDSSHTWGSSSPARNRSQKNLAHVFNATDSSSGTSLTSTPYASASSAMPQKKHLKQR